MKRVLAVQYRFCQIKVNFDTLIPTQLNFLYVFKLGQLLTELSKT